MKGCFVLALKAADTDTPTPKARFVVQRFQDLEKGVLVHT